MGVELDNIPIRVVPSDDKQIPERLPVNLPSSLVGMILMKFESSFLWYVHKNTASFFINTNLFPSPDMAISFQSARCFESLLSGNESDSIDFH